MRCLQTLQDGKRLILVDNGKITNKTISFFAIIFYMVMIDFLAKHGFHRDDIFIDVFFNAFTFDHCGGSIEYNNDRTKINAGLLKNATGNENTGNGSKSKTSRES